MDRVSLFLLGFITESYCRESGLESFVLKLVTGRVCLIKTERSFETGQHSARAMEKCHQQGTFRDHCGSHFPGKPGLSTGTTGLGRDPVRPGVRAMGQPPAEPCSGADRLVRRAGLRCRAELSQGRTAPADFILSSSLKLK